jgi:drug/metabolite transporter (DMT)-like permease
MTSPSPASSEPLKASSSAAATPPESARIAVEAADASHSGDTLGTGDPAMAGAETASANRPGLGIAMMLVGILLFVLNDVMGKWLMSTYTVGQVLLLRSFAAFLMLAPFIWREGVMKIIRAPQPGLQTLRVIFSTLEVAAFYWAVTYLPLADVMTFYMAGPIFVAALAGIFLGEHLSGRRWGMILFGFVGVVIAMRPTGAAFSTASLIAIFGSLCFAALMLTTRNLRKTSDTSLVAWQTMAALIFGAVLAPIGWVPPSGSDFILLSLLGIVAALAHICVNRSLKLAPATVVVPYQYTQIAWAMLFGYIFFGDIPETGMIVGSIVIIAAGFLIFLDEQRAKVKS